MAYSSPELERIPQRKLHYTRPCQRLGVLPKTTRTIQSRQCTECVKPYGVRNVIHAPVEHQVLPLLDLPRLGYRHVDAKISLAAKVIAKSYFTRIGIIKRCPDEVRWRRMSAILTRGERLEHVHVAVAIAEGSGFSRRTDLVG